jgi:hypothetical protein
VAGADDSDGAFGAFTFTPGETTATMTYTPASAGTKTLTFTNAQGWTNPDDVEYVATEEDSEIYENPPNFYSSPTPNFYGT